MDKKIIIKQISDSLETIQEQNTLVLNYEGQVPQIELDILMSNVKKYYEQLTFLNKLNSVYTVALSKDKIVSVNEIEREIHTKKFKSETLVSESEEKQSDIKKTESVIEIVNTVEVAEIPEEPIVEIEKEPYIKPEIIKEETKISAEETITIEEIIPLVVEEEKEIIEVAPVAPEEKLIEIDLFSVPDTAEKIAEISLFSFAEEEIVPEVKEVVIEQEEKLFETTPPIENLKIEETLVEEAAAPINEKPIITEDFSTVAEEVKMVAPEVNEPETKINSTVIDDSIISVSDQDIPEETESVKQSKEPKKPKETSKRKGKVILDLFSEFAPSVGDKFKDEKPNLNERIGENNPDASITSKIKKQPVASLKKAIGINEKFQYINELFNGNIQDYSNAINHLNDTCTTIEEARDFLEQLNFDHKWDSDHDAVLSFTTLVERRFI